MGLDALGDAYWVLEYGIKLMTVVRTEVNKYAFTRKSL